MDEIKSNLGKLKDPDIEVSYKVLNKIYEIIFDAGTKLFESKENYAVFEVIEPLFEYFKDNKQLWAIHCCKCPWSFKIYQGS